MFRDDNIAQDRVGHNEYNTTGSLIFRLVKLFNLKNNNCKSHKLHTTCDKHNSEFDKLEPDISDI